MNIKEELQSIKNEGSYCFKSMTLNENPYEAYSDKYEAWKEGWLLAQAKEQSENFGLITD